MLVSVFLMGTYPQVVFPGFTSLVVPSYVAYACRMSRRQWGA